MTVKHSFYRVEIDFDESPQHPIVYFRKERKCSTAKGMDRQHNRIVNESCDEWRQFSFRRLTVSRVPADQVPTIWATGLIPLYIKRVNKPPHKHHA